MKVQAIVFHFAFFCPTRGTRPAAKSFAMVNRPANNPQESAEHVFHKDNAPFDVPGVKLCKVSKYSRPYSASEGDVVRVRYEDGAITYLLCEGVGWKEISEWRFRTLYHRATKRAKK